MPSLKDIRRRIGSVEKTQQITRAMRMVAAAKLRRAQDAIVAARPYAERMRETLSRVAAGQTASEQPLLAARPRVERSELVVITSDRGLCGAFNANVLKRVASEVEKREMEGQEIGLSLIGRKALDFYRRRRADAITRTWTGLPRVEYSHAVEIANHVAERFVGGEVDEVLLIHSEFVTAITQRPRAVRLLPMTPEEEGKAEPGARELPFEMEPDAEQLLERLAPKALEVEIFRGLLDNQAGEHAARMTAMESATRNTEELIDRLTLEYNRARQAAITKELVEIVSGAEAL
jgi:F-type H+-transporting ATPase subunit gamma